MEHKNVGNPSDPCRVVKGATAEGAATRRQEIRSTFVFPIPLTVADIKI